MNTGLFIFQASGHVRWRCNRFNSVNNERLPRIDRNRDYLMKHNQTCLLMQDTVDPAQIGSTQVYIWSFLAKRTELFFFLSLSTNNCLIQRVFWNLAKFNHGESNYQKEYLVLIIKDISVLCLRRAEARRKQNLAFKLMIISLYVTLFKYTFCHIFFYSYFFFHLFNSFFHGNVPEYLHASL